MMDLNGPSKKENDSLSDRFEDAMYNFNRRMQEFQAYLYLNNPEEFPADIHLLFEIRLYLEKGITRTEDGYLYRKRTVIDPSDPEKKRTIKVGPHFTPDEVQLYEEIYSIFITCLTKAVRRSDELAEDFNTLEDQSELYRKPNPEEMKEFYEETLKLVGSERFEKVRELSQTEKKTDFFMQAVRELFRQNIKASAKEAVILALSDQEFNQVLERAQLHTDCPHVKKSKNMKLPSVISIPSDPGTLMSFGLQKPDSEDIEDGAVFREKRMSPKPKNRKKSAQPVMFAVKITEDTGLDIEFPTGSIADDFMSLLCSTIYHEVAAYHLEHGFEYVTINDIGFYLFGDSMTQEQKRAVHQALMKANRKKIRFYYYRYDSNGEKKAITSKSQWNRTELEVKHNGALVDLLPIAQIYEDGFFINNTYYDIGYKISNDPAVLFENAKIAGNVINLMADTLRQVMPQTNAHLKIIALKYLLIDCGYKRMKLHTKDFNEICEQMGIVEKAEKLAFKRALVEVGARLQAQNFLTTFDTENLKGRNGKLTVWARTQPGDPNAKKKKTG